VNDEDLETELSRRFDESVVSVLIENWTDSRQVERLCGVLEDGETVETLELRGCELASDASRAFANAWSLMPILTILDVSGAQIDDGGMRTIAWNLRHNPPLLTLNVDDNPFGNEGVKCIAHALESNTTLKKLSMKAPQRHRDRLDGVRVLLFVLGENKALEFLSMDRTTLSDAGDAGPDATPHWAITRMLERNASLHILHLRDCKLDVDAAAKIGGALSQNRGLTELALDDNLVENPGFCELLRGIQGNKGLVYLSLRSNRISGEADVPWNIVVDHPTLDALDLSDNPIEVPIYIQKMNKPGESRHQLLSKRKRSHIPSLAERYAEFNVPSFGEIDIDTSAEVLTLRRIHEAQGLLNIKGEADEMLKIRETSEKARKEVREAPVPDEGKIAAYEASIAALLGTEIKLEEQACELDGIGITPRSSRGDNRGNGLAAGANSDVLGAQDLASVQEELKEWFAHVAALTSEHKAAALGYRHEFNSCFEYFLSRFQDRDSAGMLTAEQSCYSASHTVDAFLLAQPRGNQSPLERRAGYDAQLAFAVERQRTSITGALNRLRRDIIRIKGGGNECPSTTAAKKARTIHDDKYRVAKRAEVDVTCDVIAGKCTTGSDQALRKAQEELAKATLVMKQEEEKLVAAAWRWPQLRFPALLGV
jgi:hypothetical protein